MALGLRDCEFKPQLKQIAHCNVKTLCSGIMLRGLETTAKFKTIMIQTVLLRDKYSLSTLFPFCINVPKPTFLVVFLFSACCSELPKFA